MADNLTTTTTLSSVPSGTVFSTDDAGAAGHVPVGKLAISTDGSATLIPADATNGLDVDVTRVQGTVAVNNAGTFATQVDGDALTALQLIDNLVQTEDAIAGSGFAGVAVLAVRQDSQTALAADGDFIPPTIDSAGGLRVSIVSGAGSGGTAAADDADFVAGTTSGTPMMGVVEATPTTVTDGDLGTVGITAKRGLKVTLFNSAGSEITADTQATQDTALGTITSVTGAQSFFRAATSTPTAVSADDDSVLGWATRNGAQVVSPVPHTTGGLSIFRSLDLDETEEDVKASAGQVYGAWVTNVATSTRWLKFYNAGSASVTVGTTTPVITIGIPGNTSDDISANFGAGGMGIAFDTAICVACTTGAADNDTGAPSANDLVVNIFYK